MHKNNIQATKDQYHGKKNSDFWMAQNKIGKVRPMPRCCVVALGRTTLLKRHSAELSCMY